MILFLLFVLAVFVGVLVLVVRSSSDARRPAMSFRESFLSVVPRPARMGAVVLLVCGAVIGPIAGYIEQTLNNGWVPFHGIPLPVLGSIIGLGMGILIGCFFAILVLALGYVYGDARRRNMPAIPWLLVALLVPNLLGFLLYFVLRRPLARPCPQCGQAITPEQRFCSWCGVQQYAPPYGTTVAPPGPTGLGPGVAG